MLDSSTFSRHDLLSQTDHPICSNSDNKKFEGNDLFNELSMIFCISRPPIPSGQGNLKSLNFSYLKGYDELQRTSQHSINFVVSEIKYPSRASVRY